MPLISEHQMLQFAPAGRSLLAGLNAGAERFEINTPLRLWHWLGQCAFESSGFRKLAEDLNYRRPETIVGIFRRYFDRNRDGAISDAEFATATLMVGRPQRLGNFVYANRLGNRDEASGDGYRHRGQGPIQLTGKDNQRAYSRAVHGDERILGDPSLLTRDPDAGLSAAWFWWRNGLNKWADTDNFNAVSALINTGSVHGVAHGLDDGDRRDVDSRYDWFLQAKQCFPADQFDMPRYGP